MLKNMLEKNFIVTCEKKQQNFLDKFFRKKTKFELCAPAIINGFRNKINTEIYKIISIELVEDKNY